MVRVRVEEMFKILKFEYPLFFLNLHTLDTNENNYFEATDAIIHIL